MKKSIRLIVNRFPVLKNLSEEREVALKSDRFTEKEKVFVQVYFHFEDPETYSFDMRGVYKYLEQDEILFLLKVFDVFYKEDTYLVKRNTAFVMKEEVSSEYVNQKGFADYLEECGHSYSRAKVKVYYDRGKLPQEDLTISNKPYWLKETVENFTDSLRDDYEG